MNRIERYDWSNCLPYLNHVIVKTSNGYALIGDHAEANYIFRFNSMEEAKKAVDAMYVTDLAFELLAAAARQGLITQEQREALTDLLDDEFSDEAASPQKLIQKYSTPNNVR